MKEELKEADATLLDIIADDAFGDILGEDDDMSIDLEPEGSDTILDEMEDELTRLLDTLKGGAMYVQRHGGKRRTKKGIKRKGIRRKGTRRIGSGCKRSKHKRSGPAKPRGRRKRTRACKPRMRARTLKRRQR